MSKKFDLLYEDIVWSLREDLADTGYVGSDFEDNLRVLVTSLKDKDYIKGDVDTIVAQLLHQHSPVKSLDLDLKDGAIPPIRLKISGGAKPGESNEDEDFSVTVIPLDHPDQQKEFGNTMLETIFADVLDFIRTQTLQNLAPEKAVETLPPAQGANAQPGEEEGASALPGVATPAPANG